MTRFVKVFVAAFALLAVASIAANAQHLISTKAGFVNRSEGKVFILRADSEDGSKGRVSLGTQMRDGDRVITGQPCRLGQRPDLFAGSGHHCRLGHPIG